MTTPDETAPAAPARRKRRPDAPIEMSPPDDASLVAPAREGQVVEADVIEVQRGAIGRADAGRIDVVQGAIGAARADHIDIDRGALGAAMAGEVQVRQGFARSILAREASVEQSLVRTLVAAEVRIEKTSLVGILLARRVVGDVRVLLDWRGAAVFGAAFGLVVALVGRVRRMRE